MNTNDASESALYNDNNQPQARTGIPPILKLLIILCILGSLLAAYYYLVLLPKKNRLLLKIDFSEFGLLYHQFYDAHGRAPSSLAELENFTPELNTPDIYDAPQAFDMIRKGRFVVIWDASFEMDGDENEKYVLGYETNAAEKGGLVLKGGGGVSFLTAEEFNGLPKINTTTN